MAKTKKFLIYFLSFTFVFSSFAFLYPQKALAFDGERFAGSDRYGTAIEISKGGWGTSENVVLATGEDFPDALCAAPLANLLHAPILLTNKSALSSTLDSELQRLGVSNVFIIGGEGVISKNVEQKLASEGKNVTRLYGSDRYDTSLEVANYIDDNFDNIISEITVATGEDFPDALSIAPVAANMGMPIILSPKDKLGDNTRSYMGERGITKAYVIGGTGVINNNVMNQLPDAERIWGTDRYETNIAVLNRFSDEVKYDKTYLATGTDFPDALAGSALAAMTSSPVILVDKTLSQLTTNFIDSKLPLTMGLGILGGEGAIASSSLGYLGNTKTTVDYTPGNTPGNLSNSGFIAGQGDWVYYNGGALYKTKTDGTGDTLLSKDVPLFINVIGDWVYYLNGSDNNKIYKTKTDGTERTKLSDDVTYFVNVEGDWIYFANGSDGGKLYKMKTDGSGKTRLNDQMVSGVSISGDWIYYTTDSNGKKLHKIKTDGTNDIIMSDGDFEFINASGDWIYYQDVGNTVTDGIKLYKIYGTEKVKISDDAAYYVNLSGDWIYYANYSDGGKLYKIKTDGTGRVKLSDDAPVMINIVGDWIYYPNKSDNKMYRIKIDGTERQALE